ncbi:MAG: hypothetical protein ACE369_13900 [Roseovarius sp.]
MLLSFVLAACGTPGPDFAGIEPARARVGASVFDIRITGLRAEALRLNPQAAPRLSSVGVAAVLAIEGVSGCRVERLTGDAAMMQATLDCGAGAPAVLKRPPALECDAFDLKEEVSDLICYVF